MATATQPSTNHHDEAKALLSSVEADQQRYRELDQQYDDAITSEHHVFTPTEYAVRRVVGYKVDDINHRKEIVAKALRVKAAKIKAGTYASRKTAKAEADKAVEKRRSRIDQLQGIVADAELELRSIAKYDSNDVVIGHVPTDEEERSKVMHDAADELRKYSNLPPYIQQQYHDSQNVCSHNTCSKSVQLSKMKSDLHNIESIVFADKNKSPDIGTDQQRLIGYGQRNNLAIEVNNGGTLSQTITLSTAYISHLKELDQRREAMLAEIDELEKEIADDTKQASSTLDFHLRKLG